MAHQGDVRFPLGEGVLDDRRLGYGASGQGFAEPSLRGEAERAQESNEFAVRCVADAESSGAHCGKTSARILYSDVDFAREADEARRIERRLVQIGESWGDHVGCGDRDYPFGIWRWMLRYELMEVAHHCDEEPDGSARAEDAQAWV